MTIMYGYELDETLFDDILKGEFSDISSPLTILGELLDTQTKMITKNEELALRERNVIYQLIK